MLDFPFDLTNFSPLHVNVKYLINQEKNTKKKKLIDIHCEFIKNLKKIMQKNTKNYFN